MVRYSAILAAILGQVGCQQSVTPPPFRALAGSDRVTVLCRNQTTGEGSDIRACPDSTDAVADYPGERHTIALVTQLYRGEVAAIDLTDNKVIDEQPAFPGTEFLPVGAMPTSIVSTPGGTATFVGVGQPGLEGIFALPTKCIMAPKENSSARELNLWPACRLSSRPGELAVVADASSVGSLANPACVASSLATGVNADPGSECSADLGREELVAPIGRRKLLVTLPDEGAVLVFDAQSILNAPPGSFGDCVPESRIALRTDYTGRDIQQLLPADLASEKSPTYNFSGSRAAIPAGMAAADGKVYVADLNVPLIHVLDVSDPCQAHEVEPLRPVDFDVPAREVFTSSVAVSSVTVAGKARGQRFLYATDVDAGSSAMVFDLSSATRTPIVRANAPLLPFEPPDRIRFEAPIKKLALVTRDAPAFDPDTNTGELGVLCNPYPDADGLDTFYRTASDYSKGAGPRKLRGIFGVMTLATGQIAAIDVEDWDAPCRRPKSNNPYATGKDWLGCANDSKLAPGASFVTADSAISTLPVTDEASCNVVEPHRMRSGRYVRTDSTLGALAPSVVTFPRLSSKENGDLSTGVTDSAHKHPQMLALPYSSIDCQSGNESGAYLNVGTTRYEQCPAGQSILDTEPSLAQHNTLILPMAEPRVFPTQEDFQVTYEGVIVAERASGQLPQYSAASAAGQKLRVAENQIVLKDPDAWFCLQGVEDVSLARANGEQLVSDADVKNAKDDAAKSAALVARAAAVDAFALAHADFVEFKSDFDDNDPYFAAGQNVGVCDELFEGRSRIDGCRDVFGTNKVPKPAREFVIREATSDQLLIEPRDTDDPATLVKQAHCCFPNVHRYQVRAARQWVVRSSGTGLLHNIVRQGTGDTPNACIRDQSPRRQHLRSRVFEISVDAKACPLEATNCAVGTAADGDVCKLSENRAALPSDFGPSASLANWCMFESIKARFAIYRGREPSVRDMTYRWAVSGGFVPLSTSIASASVGLNVVPMDMVYSEPLNAMVVVDGASGGVNLVDLTSFGMLSQPFL
jgi:hypothetical protein